MLFMVIERFRDNDMVPVYERVRDSGTAGSNSAKTDTGAGRGIDFGKGKTPEVPPIPNPYRFAARRDAILNAITELMGDRKLIVDEAASKPGEGIIVSQPYTFIKGAVVSQSELGRYADITTETSRGWTRGRYTITVEVQPIDGNNANVSVNARIEGRTGSSSRWPRATSFTEAPGKTGPPVTSQ